MSSPDTRLVDLRPETDEERAQRIVRAVFMDDLKGEIGHLARLSVPLADKQDIAKRLKREFEILRHQLRMEYLGG